MAIKLPPSGARPPPSLAQNTPAASPTKAPDSVMPPVLGPNGELLGDDYGLHGGPARDTFKPAPSAPAPGRPAMTTPSTHAAPVRVPAPDLTAPTSLGSLMVRGMRPMEPLAGGLVLGPGAVPQLNSNNPEIITTLDKGGIALSTLSKLPPLPPGAPASEVAARQRVNDARLDHAFNGDFRLFSSNQNRTGAPIHQTVAFHNPGQEPITVTVKTLASTSTQEAPYVDTQKDANNKAFVNRESVEEGVQANGPAQRTAARILQGANELPADQRTLTIPPGATVTLPSTRVPQGNELITQGEFESSGPVQAAIVYNKQPPTVEQVKRQLATDGLLPTSQHDSIPTPPGAQLGPGETFKFGRVAGVAESSNYRGVMSNSEDYSRFLTVGPGEQSFAFNTKQGNDLGAGRVESSPLTARNPNAAYASHLNYGAELQMGGVFHNPTNRPMKVQIFMDSPISSNDSRVFRGVFEVKTRESADGPESKRYLTLSQTQQTRGRTPLAEFTLPPGGSREVDLRTVYPANNTGPHSLRVVTAEPQ